MSSELSIRCSCGALRGVARGVSGAGGNRVICYCDDCQSFATFLQGADPILDAQGGTDIFQMSPARLAITEGIDHLACMRLKPGGLLRWYADCCRTPIGNTLASRQVPFVGLIHSCGPHGSDGRSRDEILGPVRGRVQARFAKGDQASLGAYDRWSASLNLRFLSRLLIARLRGDHLRSPFFDSQTGEPVAPPQVLRADELRALEAARDAS